MSVKDHVIALVEAGKATRFGPHWLGTRCLAKTRRATPCQKPAIRGRGGVSCTVAGRQGLELHEG